MKLNQNFIIHKTNSETILVPTGEADFSGIVRGNATLNVILELLKDETEETDIVAAMQNRFDAPDEAIINDVKKAIAELRKIGALDE